MEIPSDAGTMHAQTYAAVAQFLMRYAHAVDGPDANAVAEMFSQHGTLISPGGRAFRGRAAILEAVTASRATRVAGSFRLRHHISSVRIEIIDESHAVAQSYFLAIAAEQGPDHWGTYEDELKRVNGQWTFATRRTTIEGATPEGWIGSKPATALLADRGSE